MIIIYTGNGKGKTSACIGQAIRAIGQDLKIAFVQMMKRDTQAGEQVFLRQLLNDMLHIGGLGFLKDKNQKPEHEKAALSTLDWAEDKLEHLDMIILDEVLYALNAELISKERLLDFIKNAEKHNTHIVLSGRGLPAWLKEKAHIITEMQEIKHHYESGIAAIKGIEF